MNGTQYLILAAGIAGALSAAHPASAEESALSYEEVLGQEISECWILLPEEEAGNPRLVLDLKMDESGALLGSPVTIEKPRGLEGNTVARAGQLAAIGCAPYDPPPYTDRPVRVVLEK